LCSHYFEVYTGCTCTCVCACTCTYTSTSMLMGKRVREKVESLCINPSFSWVFFMGVYV
jgi:hypothetical protein